MCDYSLMEVPNRLAREGEDLVVHRFSTGTVGLASSEDLQRPACFASARPRGVWSTLHEFFNPPKAYSVCAVCVPPGALLILHDIPPEMQRQCGTGPEDHVIFTQISAEVNRHRDAVRLSTGREMRLQELKEGQRVEVLRLAATQD